MIIDVGNDELPDVSTAYDVCILGAGAIGLTLAMDLARDQNIRVAIIESGAILGRTSSGASVDNVGDVPSALAGSRAYGFGGSTSIWGGQAFPFNRIDFEKRPWVNCAEWPIREDDLKPYYDKTEEVFGVTGLSFDSDPIKQAVRPDTTISLARSGITSSVSKFSPQPNFAIRYKDCISEAQNIHCFLNASTSLVERSVNGGIEFLSLCVSDRDKRAIKATYFIIACGGIDTPKMLLKSNLSVTRKLPIGQFYQDHIGIYGARIKPKDIKEFRALFATRVVKGVKYLPKLSLDERVQRGLMLLNVTGNIEVSSDQSSPLADMRVIYKKIRNFRFDKEFWRSFRKIVFRPIQLFTAASEFLLHRRVYLPSNGEFFLIANVESEPDRKSSVNLNRNKGDDKQLGVCVDWRVSDRSRVSTLEYYQRIKAVLEDQGIASVTIKKELFEDNRGWIDHCYGLYHHIGATRMSDGPASGVVNGDLKVHGMSNLFIAGPSVLPTGSASNPTFTSIALALKLSKHIKEIMSDNPG